MDDQFVFFWGGPFSQWAKYTMEIDGKTYVTCEQYMMAEKARLFGDRETEAKIMASNNPREQNLLYFASASGFFSSSCESEERRTISSSDQRFSLDSGRASRMRTTSPTRAEFSSSCA